MPQSLPYPSSSPSAEVSSSVLTKGNGAGQYQTARSAPTSIPANSTIGITLNWPKVWADTNYTVAVAIRDVDGLLQVGFAIALVNAAAAALSFTGKTAASINVEVSNNDLSSAHQVVVEAIAIHD